MTGRKRQSGQFGINWLKQRRSLCAAEFSQAAGAGSPLLKWPSTVDRQHLNFRIFVLAHRCSTQAIRPYRVPCFAESANCLPRGVALEIDREPVREEQSLGE